MSDHEAVWAVVVTDCEGADHVMCVCDSEEQARRAAIVFNETGWHKAATVATVPRLTHDPRIVTIHERSVVIYDDGTSTTEHVTARKEWDVDLDESVTWRWDHAVYRKGVGGWGPGGRLTVTGADEGEVARMFNEQRGRHEAFAASRLTVARPQG